MSVPLVGEPAADGGRDYFVDTECGDDESGDGTRLRPLRSFRAVIEGLKAQGETILSNTRVLIGGEGKRTP